MQENIPTTPAPLRTARPIHLAPSRPRLASFSDACLFVPRWILAVVVILQDGLDSGVRGREELGSR